MVAGDGELVLSLVELGSGKVDLTRGLRMGGVVAFFSGDFERGHGIRDLGRADGGSLSLS
jgi:hypothetical protein